MGAERLGFIPRVAFNALNSGAETIFIKITY